MDDTQDSRPIFRWLVVVDDGLDGVTWHEAFADRYSRNMAFADSLLREGAIDGIEWAATTMRAGDPANRDDPAWDDALRRLLLSRGLTHRVWLIDQPKPKRRYLAF